MANQAKSIKPLQLSLGILFVIISVLLHLLLMGLATSILNLGLLIACGLWAYTKWNDDPVAVLPLYLLGVALQSLHFCEEYLTGFQREFPTLFGNEWSDQRFVTFNLIWLSVFSIAALGIYLRNALAYLVVIFFAIVGEVGNGVGHLAISIVQGRYFPGSITAPVIIVVGVVMLRRLYSEVELKKERGFNS